jgi:hypothetical protein
MNGRNGMDGMDGRNAQAQGGLKALPWRVLFGFVRPGKNNRKIIVDVRNRGIKVAALRR